MSITDNPLWNALNNKQSDIALCLLNDSCVEIYSLGDDY